MANDWTSLIVRAAAAALAGITLALPACLAPAASPNS